MVTDKGILCTFNEALLSCPFSDGEGNSFDTAILDIGEGPNSYGTEYESWAEIPQERTRLLKSVQESVNAGNAKQIIFLSGDQHWAEVMVKEIPARSGQSAVTVFEVTASGIDQNFIYDILNSNRLSPNKEGSGSIKSIEYSGVNTCSGDNLHICSARANYGGIEVDWASQEVYLSIFTPFDVIQEAVRVTLDIA